MHVLSQRIFDIGTNDFGFRKDAHYGVDALARGDDLFVYWVRAQCHSKVGKHLGTEFGEANVLDSIVRGMY